MWRAIIELFTAMFGFIGRGNRIEKRLVAMDKRILRLELLEAMRRKDTPNVCALFDEYKAMGGNSYMLELYNKYMKQQRKNRSKK